MSQWVYSFGSEKCDGDASQRNLLGEKGANLAEMSAISLPVHIVSPLLQKFAPIMIMGITIRRACSAGNDALQLIEKQTGCQFGSADNRSCFLSVWGTRLYARYDGYRPEFRLNDVSCGAFCSEWYSRFAYDSYRRFIQMFGDVVLDIDHSLFERHWTI